MGMTLLVQTLQERVFSSESDDHSLMHDYADALDEVCQQLGVPLLSAFFDYTDLNYNLENDGDDDNDDDEVLDPETGWGYGIDEMTWYEAGQGLITLRALFNYLETQSLPGLDAEESGVLLEEMADCLQLIEPLAPLGGQFNLAVIM